MSVFRDDWERKAHDIICIVKFGGYGGSIRNEELRKVADILRGHSIDPPKPKVPTFQLAKAKLPSLPVVVTTVVVPKITIGLPVFPKLP